MSLDICLYVPQTVFDANITSNLGPMAREADIYNCLWRPNDVGVKVASQLIEPLRIGLVLLQSEPERFRALNPENGWGRYEDLVELVETYLAACRENPDALVETHR